MGMKTNKAQSRRRAKKLRWSKINIEQFNFWLPQGGVRKIAVRYGVSEEEVIEKMRELRIKWTDPKPPKKPKEPKPPACLKPTIKHKTGCRKIPDTSDWHGMGPEELRSLVLEIGLSAVAYREDVRISVVSNVMKRMGIHHNVIRASTEELVAELERRGLKIV